MAAPDAAARIGNALSPVATRRAVLRSLFWGGLGATGAGSVLGAVNFAWPRRVEGFGATVTVLPSRIPLPGGPPEYFRRERFFLVHLAPGERIGTESGRDVAPADTGGVLALYARGHHVTCRPPWVVWRPQWRSYGLEGAFTCTCQSIAFSRAGIRISGPAWRSLDTMEIHVARDGTLTIYTARITPGGTDNARRAVTVSFLLSQARD